MNRVYANAIASERLAFTKLSCHRIVRLALHYGINKDEVVEKALRLYEVKTVGALDSEECNLYFSVISQPYPNAPLLYFPRIIRLSVHYNVGENDVLEKALRFYEVHTLDRLDDNECADYFSQEV